MYETTEGRTLFRVPIKGPWQRRAAFAPNGKTFAIADVFRTVRVYDAADGKLIRKLVNPAQVAHDVAYSPDAQLLAALSSDQDTHGMHDPFRPD